MNTRKLKIFGHHYFICTHTYSTCSNTPDSYNREDDNTKTIDITNFTNVHTVKYVNKVEAKEYLR